MVEVVVPSDQRAVRVMPVRRGRHLVLLGVGAMDERLDHLRS